MLEVLATVRVPMSLDDMLAVSEIRNYDLEEIHSARAALANWFLIEQQGEMMSLHKFLEIYYEEQVNKDPKRLEMIARDFGLHAYRMVMKLNDKLREVAQKDWWDEPIGVQVTNDMFRYAVTAAKLLRSVGEDELAEQLPIKVSGTLREMAFYFYQIKKDYHKSLRYAEQWLQLNSSDDEVALLRIRCYGSLGSKESMRIARSLIAAIDGRKHSRRFEARLYREKAFIAEKSGLVEEAKAFYKLGIDVDQFSPYSENYIEYVEKVGIRSFCLSV